MERTSTNFILRDAHYLDSNKKLSQKSKDRMKKSKSENTMRAYESDWNDFYDWCTFHKLNSLPAEAETIVNYINDLADHAKANTVSRRLSAISENHIAAGFIEVNPTHSGMVKNAVDAIRREKGIMQKGKMPLLLEDLVEINKLFTQNDIVSIRDKALIFLGFSGAFRRSELVKILREDLTFTNDGLIVLIKHSKGDQLGEGNYLAIPYNQTTELCTVVAIKKWLNISEIKKGPLFRPFTKNKKLRNSQLSDKSVALFVKKYATLSGLDPSDFAGHSLRRGFATSAAQHGVDEHSIMQQTRHKSEKMVRRYIEQGNMFKNNALNKMFN
jgi:site-specific recombinase XerD